VTVASRKWEIAGLYTAFALFSMAINIGAQMLAVALYSGPWHIEFSILFGTAAGLVPRYVLEKKFIFNFSSRDIGHDTRLFIMYSFMGVFTTLIFWGFEYAFHLLFASDLLRYIGGIVGLTIGFVVKYQLDKRFVFTNRAKPAAQPC
jgi:putative flippase GtrA